MYVTLYTIPSRYWHSNRCTMDEFTKSLDSQATSFLAHDETYSIHKVRLACVTCNKETCRAYQISCRAKRHIMILANATIIGL